MSLHPSLATLPLAMLLGLPFLACDASTPERRAGFCAPCSEEPTVSCDDTTLVQERFVLDLSDCACEPEVTRTDCATTQGICWQGACVEAGDPCQSTADCADEASICRDDTVLRTTAECAPTLGRCVALESQERCADSGLRCWEGACQAAADVCPNTTCASEPFSGQCEPDATWRAEVERVDLATCTCTVETLEVLCDLDEICDDDLGCALDCAEPCDESRLEEPRCDGSLAITQVSVERDEVTCTCELDEDIEDCALDGLRCEEGSCVAWDD